MVNGSDSVAIKKLETERYVAFQTALCYITDVFLVTCMELVLRNFVVVCETDPFRRFGPNIVVVVVIYYY